MPSTATNRLQGLTTSAAVKPACLTVSTTNITLSGLQTFGSVTQTDGDRHLATGQTDASENGIYIASTGSWTRALDFDGELDAVSGTRVLVRNSGSLSAEYELTTDDPIVIGTTSLTFMLRYGANATYDRTEAEIAVSVTPVSTSYPPGELLRQGTNTTPGTTAMATAFQAAIDAASSLYAAVRFGQQAALERPLLIRTTTTQNLSIIGNGRLSAGLEPTAADIKVAAQNVNCLIFNQNNNAHLHLQSFSISDDQVYTGIFLYCTEGGGADGSGQALFSAVIDDVWHAFSSNNTGIYRGGFSNLRVSKSVFEGVKTACFRLEGAGQGDQQYIGNVMNVCYDSFLYGIDDTQTKANITVDTLHVYQHMRGPIVEMKNGTGLKFTNIHLQPDAANVGTTGLLKLTDCTDVQATDLTAKTRSGVPVAACGIEIITTTTSSGVFIGIVTDATIGLRTSGAGTVDLTFIGCDFSGCENGWQHLSGNLAGTIRFYGCKLNNSLKYGMITSAGSPTFTVIIDGSCEIINAGMDTTTTARNIDISTSGGVYILPGARIGQNSGSAAATHYIRAEGSGVYKILRPVIVGTPPTAIKTGSQTVQIILEDGDTPQTLTGAGAVNLTTKITWLVTTGANALTLADGTEGQTKQIIMKTDGGDGTLTPTNLGNGTTITFNDAGDSANLLFTNAKWYFIGGTATLA